MCDATSRIRNKNQSNCHFGRTLPNCRLCIRNGNWWTLPWSWCCSELDSERGVWGVGEVFWGRGSALQCVCIDFPPLACVSRCVSCCTFAQTCCTCCCWHILTPPPTPSLFVQCLLWRFPCRPASSTTASLSTAICYQSRLVVDCSVVCHCNESPTLLATSPLTPTVTPAFSLPFKL